MSSLVDLEQNVMLVKTLKTNFSENITKTAIMEQEKITMKNISRQFKNYLYSRGTAKGLLRFKPREREVSMNSKGE